MRGLRALRPSDYMKPPFHTFLNQVFMIWPITAVMKIAQVPKERLKIANPAKLIGSLSSTGTRNHLLSPFVRKHSVSMDPRID
jgi:hypothetical protein